MGPTQDLLQPSIFAKKRIWRVATPHALGKSTEHTRQLLLRHHDKRFKSQLSLLRSLSLQNTLGTLSLSNHCFNISIPCILSYFQPLLRHPLPTVDSSFSTGPPSRLRRALNCLDMATTAVMASDTSTVRRWMCDVCKSATFTSFDEACRHEEECMKHQQELLTRHKENATERQEKKKPVHNFFSGAAKASKPTNSNAAASVATTSKPRSSEHRKTSEPAKKAQHRTAKSRRAKDTQTNDETSTQAPSSATMTTNHTVASVLVKHPSERQASDKSKMTKKRGSPKATEHPEVVDRSASTLSRKSKKAKKQAALGQFTDLTNSDSSQESASSSKKRKSDSSSLPLASIFGGRPRREILAEQRALELAAKRRLAAEKERSRQANRATTQPVTTKKSIVKAEYCPKQHISERFPEASHVGAGRGSEALSGDYSKSRAVLCKRTMHPSGERAITISPYSDLRSLPPRPATDLIFQTLSSVFMPSVAVDSKNDRLWTDKYDVKNTPSGICGSANKNVAQNCIDFVDAWKVERQKSHDTRAEKQDKLVRGKKRRTKKRVDDDIWDDSDDESLLPSVCLLTGPVGCGKTRLVHTVAQHCDCKVIEVNTTEKRGSQELRNAIEEATKSDSTFELFKRPPPAFFRKPTKPVDSDEEEDEEVRKSSVSVILLDEADLLFADNGDSGFWPALKSLSKKAKCPIFLTSNAVPQPLSALSMRFKHHTLVRPSSAESVATLLQIVQLENLTRKSGVNDDRLDRELMTFAELCGCDVRRMLNELMLFSKTKKTAMDIDSSEPKIRVESPACLANFSDADLPVLESVSPQTVKSDEPTLLKLTGRNFSRLAKSCSVSIGDEKCLAAKVVNDTTILAVCPALTLPIDVDRFGLHKRTGKRCRSRIYPVVKIDPTPAAPVFHKGANVVPVELYDGTKIPALSMFAVEYSLPSPGWHGDDSSDAESLNDPDKPETEEEEPKPCESIEAQKRQGDVVSLLLENALKEVEGVDHINVEVFKNVSSNELELSALADNLQVQSDIAWIEDAMDGLPYLAGASTGFGSSLINGFGPSASTDPQKLRRNETKPPQTERILLNGWNDESSFFGSGDVHMTSPGSRDRRLLAQSYRFCRGIASVPSCQSSTEDEDGINDAAVEDTHWKDFAGVADEDALLRCETVLSTLPSTLRHTLGAGSSNNMLSNHLFSVRRRNARRATIEFFHRIWHEANVIQVFAKGVARELSLSLISERHQADDRVFLDYSPMMSTICALEKAAIAASEATAGEASGASMSSRRQTRSAKASTRGHYLTNVTCTLYEEDLRETGEEKSNSLLRHYNL